MATYFETYEKKLIRAGLVNPGNPLIGSVDGKLVWSRDDRRTEAFRRIFEHMNIRSLVFSRLRTPYSDIVDFLATKAKNTIYPKDCETRTILQDLPVLGSLSVGDVIPKLENRKGVIIPGHGIITRGVSGIEEAYVVFASMCFSCFVKFFKDYYTAVEQGTNDPDFDAVFNSVKKALDPAPEWTGSLQKGPFETEKDIERAICEAGRRTVELRLVDSFFGNISYYDGNTLYISQTRSSLDRLEDCIVSCLLNETASAPESASSEFPAHRKIVEDTDARTILHGHPRFSVIMSMICDIKECRGGDACHLECPYPREVCGTPVVSGEVGGGVHGLCHTVPRALKDHPGVIVYGHGVFTAGRIDFNAPLQKLIEIENACRQEYFERIDRIGRPGL